MITIGLFWPMESKSHSLKFIHHLTPNLKDNYGKNTNEYIVNS